MISLVRFPLLLLLFLLCSLSLFAQSDKEKLIDSLNFELSIAKEDTLKLNIYCDLLSTHVFYHEEEGLSYAAPALALAEKLNSQPHIARIKAITGRIHWHLGQFDQALQYHFEALKVYESLKMEKHQASTLTHIAQDYADGGNYDEALNFLHRSLAINEELGDRSGMSFIYNLMSWVHNEKGNYTEGLKYSLLFVKLAEELGDKLGAAIGYLNMADSHQLLGNHNEALRMFELSLKELLALGDKINAGYTYVHIGDIHHDLGNDEAAIQSYSQALSLAREINDPTLSAKAHSTIGGLYLENGQYKDALENYQQAEKEYDVFGNKVALAQLYSQIGLCQLKLNNIREAERYFNLSETLSKELQSIESYMSYYGSKHVFDSTTGRWESAYKNYMKFISLRDSTYNKDNLKKMLSTQLQYEAEKKEAIAKAEQEKKDLIQRTVRNSIAGVLAGSLIFLVVVYRQRNKISKARKRSDELLLNILPEEVAEELKATGSAEARLINDVTVLFTDFKGFTALSEKVTPKEVVRDLHECFSAFDQIMEKYGLEKIKTIGDAYMAAGGVPSAHHRHAIDAVNAAFEILKFIEDGKARKIENNLPFFEVRVGIHTGPVVAGIVGIKKFSYDIWGDTVNTASRMESSGEVGKVNISGATHELVKSVFQCTYRGKIHAKNKGDIDMYFVDGPL